MSSRAMRKSFLRSESDVRDAEEMENTAQAGDAPDDDE